ncbi:SgcJ/EcaC family oxidoreductase [Nocardia sp. NPDC060256]|uniref:SgcJ/EcaC family oxidoreductase n=1 Tax=unclassified Nocardia TaxID=2637762 RepID=UPI00364A86B4
MNTTQQTDSDADLSAIRAIFGDLSDTWDRGDAAGFAALFTQDAQYTTNFGLTLQGRAQIEQGHRLLFESPHRSAELVLLFGEEPQIRLVRPDVAIVLIGGGTSDGGEVSLRENGARSTLTYVILRESAGWLISMFQNTRRTPMPGAEDWSSRFALPA